MGTFTRTGDLYDVQDCTVVTQPQSERGIPMNARPLIVYVDSFVFASEHERLTQIVSLERFRAEHAVSADPRQRAERRLRAIERSRARVPYE